jgi:hypothetical protein
MIFITPASDLPEIDSAQIGFTAQFQRHAHEKWDKTNCKQSVMSLYLRSEKIKIHRKGAKVIQNRGRCSSLM